MHYEPADPPPTTTTVSIPAPPIGDPTAPPSDASDAAMAVDEGPAELGPSKGGVRRSPLLDGLGVGGDYGPLRLAKRADAGSHWVRPMFCLVHVTVAAFGRRDALPSASAACLGL
jgi:hypothetical protein